MNILLLCDMFPPAFGPRMGYLVKYLQKQEHKVTVVTEQQKEDNSFRFLSKDTNCLYINYYPNKSTAKKNKLSWLKIQFLDLLFNYKDKKMVEEINKNIKDLSFDIVLCSTYRTFPLQAAQRIAQQLNIPFVADLRDITEQYASHEFISKPFHTIPFIDHLFINFFRWQLLYKRNKVIRKANAITTVSEWHTQVIGKYNKQVELIYNGYDPELFYPIETTPNKKFIISYTGRILSFKTRDPRYFFAAIQQLDKEGVISKDDFRIEWYMDKPSDILIKELANSYQINDYMDYCGYVAADQIPNILHHSSILLQLANKADEQGPKGIMSTKLFEALAVEKPLLCVRSDESYLEKTIAKANAGASARNAEEAYVFIKEQYLHWKNTGDVSINVNRSYVSQFSREAQAQQFAALFESLKRN